MDASLSPESLLEELVARELSSIEFVRGYLQFRFDGPTLTVLTAPSIFSDGRKHTDGAPGFRDRLVELVGKEVSQTKFKPDDELVLVFKTGEILRIPLDRDSRRYPGEAMVFDFNDEAHRTVVA